MPTNLSTGTTADILLVAGGGGAGSNMGGGGGAGGVTSTSQFLNFSSYNITVGAGGSGAPAGTNQVRGSNGADSAIINTSTTATYSVMFQAAQSLTPGTNALFAYTGNFTVEGWIYRLATGDASMIVQGTSPYFAINVNAGTGINVYLNNATANLVVTDRVPAIQTWNHIALVRSGGIVKVYLNGVPSATTASNATTLGFSASNLYIGANNVTGGANQYISNVRVTNGTALYTNTFTVSSTPLTPVTNTVLLACSSSTYTKDYSTSSASLIASGAIAGSPFGLLWNPFYPTFVTVGGGGGGSDYTNPATAGSFATFGGSGGGAQSSSSLFGIGITGQGYSGVTSIGNYYASGGGGATSVGTSAATGNAGGSGLSSSILGTTYYWGGGGGGSGYSNLSGNGGAGGGGGGAPLSGGSASGTGGGYGNTQGINSGVDAIAGSLGAVTNKAGGNGGTNTGGGGGGGSHQSATNAGGTGGSGAVVIRYTGPQRGTGGTIYSYTSGSTLYTAHAFFTSAIFTLYPFPLYAQANGGQGGPYGGGGGGAGNWYSTAGGLGANGSASTNTGYQMQAGGSGGGASTTAASGGGGGVDVYGITTSSNYIISGGSANNPGLGGALFNLGGRPGTGGNGGLYGGGGSGAAVGSVDTNTGNGAGGAFLIVYNTTASTYSYPSIMPVAVNSVSTASATLLVASSTTNKTLLTQFDNIITSYQSLQYKSLNTGNLVNYDSVDVNALKISQSQSVVAGNLQVITYITDHEMMLKNSDPNLPATYNTPGNYQFIQEIRPDNDPRLITVRVQNYVIGVTGSDASQTVSVTAGGQIWF